MEHALERPAVVTSDDEVKERPTDLLQQCKHHASKERFENAIFRTFSTRNATPQVVFKLISGNAECIVLPLDLRSVVLTCALHGATRGLCYRVLLRYVRII